MYRERCRIGWAVFVLMLAGAGVAQTSGSLPDAPSAVLARDRLAETVEPQVSSQLLKQERVRGFLPGTGTRMRTFQSEPLVFNNDVERLTAIGHKFMPALPNQTHFRYERSDAPDVLGRATHAITRVLLFHDREGRVQANGAYLVGAMLTSVLATAYQPYERHDPTEVLGNFGSTVGGAAGINLFREFWPQLKQRLSSQVPHVLQRPAAAFKDR